MSTLTDRLYHAWNAFMNKDPTRTDGPSYTMKPDRIRLSRGNDKSIVTAVYNRIALDAAACILHHVRLDENGRYIEDMKTGLNYCLSESANLDQTGRGMVQDGVMSMLDEGVVAFVPIETDISPQQTAGYDITQIRIGKVIEWRAKEVKVKAYDERDGKHKEFWIDKSCTSIVENPFFAVMNETNSTAKRLMRKLAILDAVDEQNGAGKMDLIIQLPYVVKNEARRAQAEARRKDIEMQLSSSKYGVVYTDGTERVTQLNRSVDNQLLTQIDTLTRTLYSQLGITEEIMNGTADEKTLNNYYTRTIEPILSAITDEMNRKFLSKTARTRRQRIVFYRDPFKLVPTTALAELADKLTRNEIMTSNELRQVMGMKPSGDPNADALRNKNLSVSPDQQQFDVDGNIINTGNALPTEEQYSEDGYDDQYYEQ